MMNDFVGSEMRIANDFSDLWSNTVNQHCSVFNDVSDVRSALTRCNRWLDILRKQKVALAGSLNFSESLNVDVLNAVVDKAKEAMKNLKSVISSEMFDIGCDLFGGARMTEDVFTNIDILCNLIDNISRGACGNTNILGEDAITRETYKEELDLLSALSNACGELEDGGGYGYTGNPQRFLTADGKKQSTQYDVDAIKLVSSIIPTLASKLMDISSAKLNGNDLNYSKTDEEVFREAEQIDGGMTDEELDIMYEGIDEE